MYERILVPTDGSAGTDRALEHAVAIASRWEATVHALSVVDRRVYISASGDHQEEIKASLRGQADDAVEAVRERVEREGLQIETAVLDGIPHTEIVEYATDAGVDLIVMGTHGRTGRDRLANLGSVTERVVENADRPVLVVQIGDE